MNQQALLQIKDDKVWDMIRKKWVHNSPEELVRQQVIHYLVYQKKYPPTLIAVEKEFRFQHLKKRFDVLVMNKQQQAHILIECKRESIDLKQEVVQQLMPYVLALQPKYVVITNGKLFLCHQQRANEMVLIENFPNYMEDKG